MIINQTDKPRYLNYLKIHKCQKIINSIVRVTIATYNIEPLQIAMNSYCFS